MGKSKGRAVDPETKPPKERNHDAFAGNFFDRSVMEAEEGMAGYPADLRLGKAEEVLIGDQALEGKANLVVADPPWDYANFRTKSHGAASAYYRGLTMGRIVTILATSAKLIETGYMVVWCTTPKREEYADAAHAILKSFGWLYVTGGAWVKTDGLKGIGWHVANDMEEWSLYKKGGARPVKRESNVFLGLAPRVGHSEKPQPILKGMIGNYCPPGGLVVDLFAGATGAVGRAAMATGRRYVGAEVDPARHEEGLLALRQVAFDVPWTEPKEPAWEQMGFIEPLTVK